MIGEQFGNYKSISLLGEGGMGAVYLAEHPGIGRRVAVKVLHKNYTRDEHLLARFLNEARAANAIRHPNIIEILDSGMMADGTPFLVMELLEGESLGTRLRQNGALSLQTAVDFAYQTASALGAAHAKGIVHRDLKPDNLFVVPDPHDSNRERIKVLDFGIAKLQQGSVADSVKTRTGTLMGTPIYMSPEQCRGTRTVDHRSDIYSLGVIFYEMLVGQPPFVSEGFGDLVNMHLNIAPVPARTRRPEIPPALDAIVMKMLAKNPDERYQQIADFQAALKSSGSHQIVSSPDLVRTHAKSHPVAQTSPMHDTTFSAGTGERVETEVVRGRGKTVVVGALAAVAVAGGIVYWQFGGGGSVEKPTAPIAMNKPVAPPTAPPPVVPVAAVKPVAAAAKPAPVAVKVELRLASIPAGAKVVDNAGGELLGVTPLVLTRPRGGSVTLRFEKDGYLASTRTMPLDGDRAFELTLDAKPKKKDKKPRESGPAEPAKL
ncbi:MAG TPA: serine/threonine-protein kinase [Polyangia bacterium]|jgi:serine/threonine-protein kinase